MACLTDETILDFVEGRLGPAELSRVDLHASECTACQTLISAALAVGSSARPSVTETVATARQDLSCRYLVPLLTLADDRVAKGEREAFFASWNVSVAALRDESGWVSLRFCEELTEWLAARVGIDAIISQTLRESYSPRTMGILYPFVRAFGSPRVGYGRLPSFVRLLNRASDVRVLAIGRNRATISYRPTSEATREESPLICQIRRAQIAAGPSIWNLPHAIVEEAECQARGADRCVYQISWVQPSRWWRAMFAGLGAAALAWIATGGSRPAAVLALVVGILAVRAWGARRDLQAHRTLHDLEMRALARVTHLRPASITAASEHDGDNAARASGAVSQTEADVFAAAGLVAPPQPGDRLASRYRLERLLGVGGMGFVYAAVDEASGQTLALKVLRPELSLSPRWVDRMAREVRIARTIEHAHVCRVMSFGQVDGYHFLTMELATGGSLASELRAPATAKTWDERLRDVGAIVSGLVAVHEAGIVHRDLTPHNILRFSGGRLAIADFGLAVDQPGQPTSVAGTPNYIAPEVLAGGKATFRSDVWQLGVLMHEVLFGCRPDMSRRTALAAGQERLAELCARCTHADPSGRPANARAVADALGDRAQRPRTLETLTSS